MLANATVNHARLTLSINGDAYSVRPLSRDELAFGAVRAFRLTRRDKIFARVAHVVVEAIDGLNCNCDDFRPKQSTCKHLAACRACGLF